MSYLINPQSGEGISPTQVFDKGCAETRLRELTTNIIQILVQRDVKALALEHKRAFEAVPPYPLKDDEILEKFYKDARKEAERILEAERKNVVDQRAEYIKNTLKIVIRQLQMLVQTEHGKGKLYIERKVVQDNSGSYRERDVTYFEFYPEGVERAEQIGRVSEKLSAIRDYIPYLNAELAELWKQASDLANLEIVRKDADTRTAAESAEISPPDSRLEESHTLPVVEEHTEIAETEERKTEEDKAEV